MESGKWKKKICEQMRSIDLNPDEYKPVIDTLADILEQRDAVLQKYIDNGAQPVVEHAIRGGGMNYTKNPLLILWNDVNGQALAHWRELCLTPSAYKKTMGVLAVKDKKTSALVEALKSL